MNERQLQELDLLTLQLTEQVLASIALSVFLACIQIIVSHHGNLLEALACQQTQGMLGYFAAYMAARIWAFQIELGACFLLQLSCRHLPRRHTVYTY